MNLRITVIVFAVLTVGCGLPGCATKTITPFEFPDAEYAKAPATDGELAELAASVEQRHGPGVSGFWLLDTNRDGLYWRIALIDAAKHSIDAQYYLWYGDSAGRILIKRLQLAADRGVKVRLLVDDLNTILHDAGRIGVRDDIVAWIDSHPNIELRLFNPWTQRGVGGRVGESLGDFDRVNHRMHNKALIADNRAAIIGGRNIGDEYMGLNESFNFHDLDVLGVGPVATQTSTLFDEYWNGRWVAPVSALGLNTTSEEADLAASTLERQLREDPALAEFPLEPRTWATELKSLGAELLPGTSEVIGDKLLPDGFEMIMLERIRSMLASATESALIINSYIIPGDYGISTLKSLGEKGVNVKILTNSLASHDVPAVNSHYRRWRKPIIQTGAELFELRHDAEIQSTVTDTSPIVAGFVGLHSKAMVIDARHTYIGSFNYDPRSAIYNTEMGVFIDSPALGAEVVSLAERDMSPENSWQVNLDDNGKLVWTNDEEATKRQPARNFWQRIEDFFLRAVPKEYY